MASVCLSFRFFFLLLGKTVDRPEVVIWLLTDWTSATPRIWWWTWEPCQPECQSWLDRCSAQARMIAASLGPGGEHCCELSEHLRNRFNKPLHSILPSLLINGVISNRQMHLPSRHSVGKSNASHCSLKKHVSLMAASVMSRKQRVILRRNNSVEGRSLWTRCDGSFLLANFSERGKSSNSIFTFQVLTSFHPWMVVPHLGHGIEETNGCSKHKRWTGNRRWE